MSGISTIYCIGSGGGFMGGDGPNPILAQIWLGEGCRMWYEARYFEKGFGPLGQLKTLIPPEPDGPDNLLDACLAFFPKASRPARRSPRCWSSWATWSGWTSTPLPRTFRRHGRTSGRNLDRSSQNCLCGRLRCGCRTNRHDRRGRDAPLMNQPRWAPVPNSARAVPFQR
jgi:hypothetical protein